MWSRARGRHKIRAPERRSVRAHEAAAARERSAAGGMHKRAFLVGTVGIGAFPIADWTIARPSHTLHCMQDATLSSDHRSFRFSRFDPGA